MENHLDQIRAALADDATDDIKVAGALACRAVLRALELQPTAAPELPPRYPPTPAQPTRAVGELPVLVALRAMPRAQLLDHVIARLKALQPDAPTGPVAVGAAIAAMRSLSFDQLLDLGVAKLRAALTPPATPSIPPGARVIHLAPPSRR